MTRLADTRASLTLFRRRLAAVGLCLTLLLAASVRAETRVEVAETFPAGRVITLPRGQNFYLHLHYDTDRPVNIWARPYYQGRPARAGGSAAVPPPDWVETLNARDAEQRRLIREENAKRDDTLGSALMFSGFMIAVLVLGVLGFVLPIRALMKWRGGWRMAAVVPVALIGFVVLRIMVGTFIDPTSHNLWPFEVLIIAVISVGIMVGLTLLRKMERVEES